MAEDSGEKKRGLGDLVDGLSQLIDLVDKIQSRGDEGYNRSGEFKNENSGVSGRYGVSIKGMGGAADKESGVEQYEVQPEKRARRRPPPPSRTSGMQERVPFVDVMESEGSLTIVAEMPGAREDSIELNVNGMQLDLFAAAKDRTYRKTVDLPFEIDSEPSQRSYVNGIFSAVFKRAEEETLQ